LPPQSVGEVMNRHAVTVRPDSDLADAVDLLTSIGVKSLPVIDDHGTVVGVISRRDVVRILAKPDSQIEAETDDLFRRIGLEWSVVVRGDSSYVESADLPEFRSDRPVPWARGLRPVHVRIRPSKITGRRLADD